MKGLLALLATAIGGWLILNLIGAFLVGAIARRLFPARDRIGWPTTIVVGFLGGLVGKLAFRLLGWPTGIVMGFVASVAGAFVLLLVHHVWRAGKAAKSGAVGSR